MNSLHLQPPIAPPAPTMEPEQSAAPEPANLNPPSTSNSGNSALDELLKDTFTRAKGMDDHLPDPTLDPIDNSGDPVPPAREIVPAFPDDPRTLPASGMSHDESMKQTALIMGMRNVIQSMGISWVADGTIKNKDQYSYGDFEMNMLIEAWNPVIQSSGIKVSPFVHIAYAEAVASGPIVALAFNNRKQRLLLEEQAAEIARLKQQATGNNNAENVMSHPASLPASRLLRADTKNQWKIDENGYFENTVSGGYIKKPNRREKPDLTPEAYTLLCKHNDPALVDEIFKIGRS